MDYKASKRALFDK